MPSAIDTPIFQHAANYTGRPIRPLHPTYPAEKVRQVIVLVEGPKSVSGGWNIPARRIRHALAIAAAIAGGLVALRRFRSA